jgi:LmbE family N-acetylglucosaminyl deacetylase
MSSPSKILVVAPHPDDETLGCGGTILRHLAQGDEVHWLIVTSIDGVAGFSSERVAKRASEIETVAARYGFTSVQSLGLPTTRLDTLPKGDIVQHVGKAIGQVQPDTVYMPYRNDVHSDHAAVFDAVISATKTFRTPFVRRLYVYETLSETEFGLRPDDPGFKPNLFVDIATWLPAKLDIMACFEGEMGVFPFPRSKETIEALARLRGSQAGCHAAEAFMILKELR